MVGLQRLGRGGHFGHHCITNRRSQHCGDFGYPHRHHVKSDSQAGTEATQQQLIHSHSCKVSHCAGIIADAVTKGSLQQGPTWFPGRPQLAPHGDKRKQHGTKLCKHHREGGCFQRKVSRQPKCQVNYSLHPKKNQPGYPTPAETSRSFEQSDHQQLQQSGGNIYEIDAHQLHDCRTASAH